MSDKPPNQAGKRTVTLPTDEYLKLQGLAEAEGISLSAWVLDAARQKRARRAADNLARGLAADAEAAAELEQMRAEMGPWRDYRNVRIQDIESGKGALA